MTPPRLVPERPFPPYSYVPGRFPHPHGDPEGHSYGHIHATPLPLDEQNWSDNRDYLFGIDLFNHGYYWEAHEVWEGLWMACGRRGRVATFLKGLIQLTAAGVKVRQQVPRGVQSLAEGATELFGEVRASLGPDEWLLGLDVGELIAFARELAARPERDAGDVNAAVQRVLSLVLTPRGDAA
jgi:predicted metal-dependent hydrolase